jgi:hypothetical protein
VRRLLNFKNLFHEKGESTTKRKKRCSSEERNKIPQWRVFHHMDFFRQVILLRPEPGLKP